MAKLQINTPGKSEVCVCHECNWIYVNDKPFACENEQCSLYGKKGEMAFVVVLPKKQKKAIDLLLKSGFFDDTKSIFTIAMYEWIKKQDLFNIIDELKKTKR